jgi:hypothetical protein
MIYFYDLKYVKVDGEYKTSAVSFVADSGRKGCFEMNDVTDYVDNDSYTKPINLKFLDYDHYFSVEAETIFFKNGYKENIESMKNWFDLDGSIMFMGYGDIISDYLLLKLIKDCEIYDKVLNPNKTFYLGNLFSKIHFFNIENEGYNNEIVCTFHEREHVDSLLAAENCEYIYNEIIKSNQDEQ